MGEFSRCMACLVTFDCMTGNVKLLGAGNFSISINPLEFCSWVWPYYLETVWPFGILLLRCQESLEQCYFSLLEQDPRCALLTTLWSQGIPGWPVWTGTCTQPVRGQAPFLPVILHFAWFFPQPVVVSSHAVLADTSMVPPRTSRGLFLCGSILSSALSCKLQWPWSHRLLASVLQLKELARFHLGSHPGAVTWTFS